MGIQHKTRAGTHNTMFEARFSALKTTIPLPHLPVREWQLTACLTRRFSKATYGGQRPNLHLPSLVKASKNPITANFMRSLGSNEVLFQIFRKHQQQTSRANWWELFDFKKNLRIFSVTNSKQRRNDFQVPTDIKNARTRNWSLNHHLACI